MIQWFHTECIQCRTYEMATSCALCSSRWSCHQMALQRTALLSDTHFEDLYSYALRMEMVPVVVWVCWIVASFYAVQETNKSGHINSPSVRGTRLLQEMEGQQRQGVPRCSCCKLEYVKLPTAASILCVQHSTTFARSSATCVRQRCAVIMLWFPIKAHAS